MKVIDLLNKIANGEEVPKEIKIRGIVFKFIEQSTKNLTFANSGSNINYAYENAYVNYWLDCARVNEEIEIIEEDKEIEKIDFRTLNTQKEKNRVMKDTINQLIDEINELKKGK